MSPQRMLLDILFQSFAAVSTVAIGTCLGALLGVLLAVFLVRYFRQSGWLRVELRYGRAMRWIGAILLALELAGCGAGLGFLYGVGRAAENSFREGPLREQLLNPAAQACATGLIFLDSATQNILAGGAFSLSEAQLAHIQRFEAGEVEIDAAGLRDRIGRVQTALPEKALTELHDQLRTRLGIAADSLVDQLMVRALGTLAGVMFQGTAVDGVLGSKTRTALKATVASLPDAARGGATSALSHAELTAHLVDQALVPIALSPLHSALGLYRGVLWFLAVLFIGKLMLAFWILRRIFPAKAAPAPHSVVAEV